MSLPALVISVWGDPSGWDQVTYRFLGTSYRSKTTLLPIVAGLSGRFQHVEALLVVPDTLAAIWWRSFRSWADVSSATAALVREYLGRFVDEFNYVNSLRLGSFGLDVAVCPGVGRYSVGTGWALFEGSLEGFLLCALLNSLTKALELSKGGGLAIYVDLSHGVNYLPSALALVSHYLRGILELRGVEVSLTLLNSDPYRRPPSRDGCGSVELEIHELHPPKAPEVIPQPGAGESDVLELLGKPRKLLSKEFRGRYAARCGYDRGVDPALVRAVRELWYSAYYGYVLHALQRGLPRLAQPAGTLLPSYVAELSKTLYGGLELVKVEEGGGSYRVRTSSALEPGTLGTCVKLLQVLAAVDYLATSMSRYLARDQREGYSIGELREVYETVLRRLTPPQVEHLYGREVAEIKRDVCTYTCLAKNLELGWTLWTKLKEEIKRLRTPGEECVPAHPLPHQSALDEECVRRCTEDRSLDSRTRVRYSEGFNLNLEDRNAIAHLGLLYNGVEVSLEAPKELKSVK